MRFALLIDADNISAAHAPTIFSHASKLGTAAIRRVYGGTNAMPPWTAATHDELCEMRPLSSLRLGKNGTDIALAIDAMDILHGGAIGAFCIASNDRDFVPLAIRLRAVGKSVHAICLRSDERHAKVFDSVLELEPEPAIVQAFRAITRNREPELSLPEAGKLLREHSPGLIPTTGKAPLRKALEATGMFEFPGTGSSLRARLVK